MSKSKYLNQKFNGWKVIAARPDSKGHASFLLKRHFKYVIVRDNVLTNLAKGLTNMKTIIKSKKHCCEKSNRTIKNTVYKARKVALEALYA